MSPSRNRFLGGVRAARSKDFHRYDDGVTPAKPLAVLFSYWLIEKIISCINN